MSDRTYLHDLLFKKLAGHLDDPAEISLVDKALAEDPEMRKEWEQLQQTFNDPEVKAHFENIDHKAVFEKITGSGRRHQLYWRAAAAALVIIVTGSAYFLLRRPAPLPVEKGVTLRLESGKTISMGKGIFTAGGATIQASRDTATFKDPTGGISWNTLQVPNKLFYTLQLEDGSTITMNSASALRFPSAFAARSREVFLQYGEAYFSIAPDATRPFIVHTDSADITVLGTSFNVNMYIGFKASLVGGAIKIATGGRSIELSPGQEAYLTEGELKTGRFDPDMDISWLTGTQFFNEVTLAEFAAAIERTYDVRVFFDNKDIASEKIVGALSRRSSIEQVITNINSLHASKYRVVVDKSGNLHFVTP